MDYSAMNVNELLSEIVERDAARVELMRKAMEELEVLEARKLELTMIIGKRPRAASVPKYRDQANPEKTWSGKGKKPEWFASWVADGKDPADLLIHA